MAVALYQDACDMFIRPPRAEYPVEALGPSQFVVGDKTYCREDISLVNGRGLRLACSHFQPIPSHRPRERLPCVVYLHGNGGCRLDGLEHLELIVSSCEATFFVMDFAGSGHSEGEYISLGYFEKADVECAVEYLQTQKGVGSISLWGRSMGASTALLYSAAHPQNVKCLILDSAFTSLKKLAMEVTNCVETPLPKFMLKGVFYVGLKFVRRSVAQKAKFDIYEVEPIAHISRCQNIPALFVHGDSDMLIKIEHCHQLTEKYPGRHRKMTVAGDHNSLRPAAFLDEVADFLHESLYSSIDAKLRPPSPPRMIGSISQLYGQAVFFCQRVPFDEMESYSGNWNFNTLLAVFRTGIVLMRPYSGKVIFEVPFSAMVSYWTEHDHFIFRLKANVTASTLRRQRNERVRRILAERRKSAKETGDTDGENIELADDYQDVDYLGEERVEHEPDCWMFYTPVAANILTAVNEVIQQILKEKTEAAERARPSGSQSAPALGAMVQPRKKRTEKQTYTGAKLNCAFEGIDDATGEGAGDAHAGTGGGVTRTPAIISNELFYDSDESEISVPVDETLARKNSLEPCEDITGFTSPAAAHQHTAANHHIPPPIKVTTSGATTTTTATTSPRTKTTTAKTVAPAQVPVSVPTSSASAPVLTTPSKSATVPTKVRRQLSKSTCLGVASKKQSTKRRSGSDVPAVVTSSLTSTPSLTALPRPPPDPRHGKRPKSTDEKSSPLSSSSPGGTVRTLASSKSLSSPGGLLASPKSKSTKQHHKPEKTDDKDAFTNHDESISPLPPAPKKVAPKPPSGVAAFKRGVESPAAAPMATVETVASSGDDVSSVASAHIDDEESNAKKKSPCLTKMKGQNRRNRTPAKPTTTADNGPATPVKLHHHGSHHHEKKRRSEERRVGKECRSRWSPYH
eukprot:TRINITY_DN9111_c0_g1_i3.p1 TRINITY_DN9111_c0_g1~~TRINITY_DN9111_c0_g1_i3.p1  ORF type:complete len:913 (+),score=165.18 TRINITY_DN9111_c0_g1_i3:342-3080(+)